MTLRRERATSRCCLRAAASLPLSLLPPEQIPSAGSLTHANPDRGLRRVPRRDREGRSGRGGAGGTARQTAGGSWGAARLPHASQRRGSAGPGRALSAFILAEREARARAYGPAARGRRSIPARRGCWRPRLRGHAREPPAALRHGRPASSSTAPPRPARRLRVRE